MPGQGDHRREGFSDGSIQEELLQGRGEAVLLGDFFFFF